MKTLFTGFLTLIIFFAQAQEPAGISRPGKGVTVLDKNHKIFKTKAYHKNNDKWFFTDSISQKNYEADTSVITIKFKPVLADTSIVSIAQRYGITYLRKSKTGWYDYKVNSKNFFAVVDSMDLDSSTKEVIVPYFMELHDVQPDDPEFINQWHLTTIQAPQAWDIQTGNPSVVVAVIDGPIKYTHDELGLGSDNYDIFFRNPGEDAWPTPFSGGNNVDDDNNMKEDDWIGWNFHNGAELPSGNDWHGDRVTSVLAGKTNNNNLTAGVAGGWNSQGVAVLRLQIGNGAGAISASLLDDAIDYAVEMDADIINYSSGGSGLGQDGRDALTNAKNEGVLIVASSGNGNTNQVDAPARYYTTMGVGGTDINDQRAVWSSGTQGAQYGNGILVAAPAKDIVTSAANSKWVTDGTSYAAPIVSGIAALMLSENPCLSNLQLQDIMEQTAEKVGSYGYNSAGISSELGHGRVNAFEAVKVAQEIQSTELDLYLKDSDNDFGQSPSPGHFTDRGPDIWYRNDNDGFANQYTEPLNFDGTSFFVYVRVRNKSCADYSQSDPGQLSLHWSKLGTASSWTDGHWHNLPEGEKIGSLDLPDIKAGKSAILEFEWDMAHVLSSASAHVHACLLARIENVTDDGIGSSQVALWNSVKNENNITMKNVEIQSAQFFKNGNRIPIMIGGADLDSTIYNIRFHAPEHFIGNALYEEAEIMVYMDQEVWNKWEQNGSQGNNIQIEDAGERSVLITGDNATLENLPFEPLERGQIEITVHFLMDDMSDKNEFLYHVSQELTNSEMVTTGAVHLTILKEPREPFDADAGEDDEIYEHELHSLQATPINEPATYNWYNEKDSLIYTGTGFTVSPDSTTNYKLEVKAHKDGFKDYDFVNIKVKHKWISSVSPNPSSGITVINYNLTPGIQNAKVKLLNQQGTVLLQQTCSIQNTSTTLDVTSYTPGLYTIVLECDGEDVEAKQIVVQ